MLFCAARLRRIEIRSDPSAKGNSHGKLAQDGTLCLQISFRSAEKGHDCQTFLNIDTAVSVAGDYVQSEPTHGTCISSSRAGNAITVVNLQQPGEIREIKRLMVARDIKKAD